MGISPRARACLLNYEWPGNVRELENAIERAVVLGNSDLILPEDLPESILDKAAPAGASAEAFHDAVRESKKQLIISAVEQVLAATTRKPRGCWACIPIICIA